MVGGPFFFSLATSHHLGKILNFFIAEMLGIFY